MEANVTGFIRKWNGRTLQDDGSSVSKEFHSFQVAFINAMRKIATALGGEVVGQSYGHYDMSGFIRRGDKYVYFSYSNGCCRGGRTFVNLKEQWDSCGCNSPLLIRTAADSKDFRGGCNHFASFEKCQGLIDKLLNTEHRRV